MASNRTSTGYALDVMAILERMKEYTLRNEAAHANSDLVTAYLTEMQDAITASIADEQATLDAKVVLATEAADLADQHRESALTQAGLADSARNQAEIAQAAAEASELDAEEAALLAGQYSTLADGALTLMGTLAAGDIHFATTNPFTVDQLPDGTSTDPPSVGFAFGATGGPQWYVWTGTFWAPIPIQLLTPAGTRVANQTDVLLQPGTERVFYEEERDLWYRWDATSTHSDTFDTDGGPYNRKLPSITTGRFRARVGPRGVNVRNFLGIPTGFASEIDQGPAFQEAINWALRNNHALHIPSGDYYISTPLTIEPQDLGDNRLCITGDGQEITQLFFNPASTTDYLFTITTMQRMKLAGFAIKGMPGEIRPGGGIVAGGPDGAQLTRSELDGVFLFNLTEGFDSRFVDSIAMYNVQANDCGIGLDLDGSTGGGWCNAVELVACRVEAGNDIGVLKNGGQLTVFGGMYQANDVAFQIGHSAQVLLDGAYFESNSGGHLLVGQTPGDRIDALHVYNCQMSTQDPIRIDGVTRGVFDSRCGYIIELGAHNEDFEVKNPANISNRFPVVGRQQRGVAVSRMDQLNETPAYATDFRYMDTSSQFTNADPRGDLSVFNINNFTASYVPASVLRSSAAYHSPSGEFYPTRQGALRLDLTNPATTNTRIFFEFSNELLQQLNPYDITLYATWYHPAATPRIYWTFQAIYDYDNTGVGGGSATNHVAEIRRFDPLAVYFDGKRDRWHQADFPIPLHEATDGLDPEGRNSFGHIIDQESLRLRVVLQMYVNTAAVGGEWTALANMALYNTPRVRTLGVNPVAEMSPALHTPHTLQSTNILAPSAETGAYRRLVLHDDGTVTCEAA